MRRTNSRLLKRFVAASILLHAIFLFAVLGNVSGDHDAFIAVSLVALSSEPTAAQHRAVSTRKTKTVSPARPATHQYGSMPSTSAANLDTPNHATDDIDISTINR